MNRAPETLYIQDNTKTIRVWTIGVLDWRIIMQYGQLNGALQTRYEDVLEGKAGRTREQQIISRMQSRIKKQRDLGYSFDIDDAMKRPVNSLGLKKPMLAQPFAKVKNLNIVNSLIQPKFDGNRCIITMQQGKMIAYSRRGLVIAANLDHIFIGLNLDEGDYVDGELYCHGYSLQTIVSWIKRNQPETKKLKFHAYDLIDDHPYHERYDELMRKVNGGAVILTPTRKIKTTKEMWDAHKEFVKDGYEGIIIRWTDLGYEDGKRSRSLVKAKIPEDDIFYIVGAHPSKDGWAILDCITAKHVAFKVSAPGTIIEKELVLQYKENYIGKTVRVEFYGYTKDGVPFQPVATNFPWEV